MRKKWRNEIAELAKRVKQLECEHKTTEFREWIDTTRYRIFYKEVCSTCGKVIREITDSEYHLEKKRREIEQAKAVLGRHGIEIKEGS